MNKFADATNPDKDCFAKLQLKQNPSQPASICTTTGDAGVIEAKVDVFVDDILSSLEGALSPQCTGESERYVACLGVIGALVATPVGLLMEFNDCCPAVTSSLPCTEASILYCNPSVDLVGAIDGCLDEIEAAGCSVACGCG